MLLRFAGVNWRSPMVTRFRFPTLLPVCSEDFFATEDDPGRPSTVDDEFEIFSGRPPANFGHPHFPSAGWSGSARCESAENQDCRFPAWPTGQEWSCAGLSLIGNKWERHARRVRAPRFQHAIHDFLPFFLPSFRRPGGPSCQRGGVSTGSMRAGMLTASSFTYKHIKARPLPEPRPPPTQNFQHTGVMPARRPPLMAWSPSRLSWSLGPIVRVRPRVGQFPVQRDGLQAGAFSWNKSAQGKKKPMPTTTHGKRTAPPVWSSQ